jgi:hypothetical protein
VWLWLRFCWFVVIFWPFKVVGVDPEDISFAELHAMSDRTANFSFIMVYVFSGGA